MKKLKLLDNVSYKFIKDIKHNECIDIEVEQDETMTGVHPTNILRDTFFECYLVI